MALTLSNDLLERLSELISANLGLHFPPNRFGDLERGLLAASEELGCANLLSCAVDLISGETPMAKDQTEILASNLTIGETYFFRESRTIDALRNRILPEMISAKRAASSKRIRIWSAACSSGEEPYTIAMLLDEVLPDISDWRITIVGTDINPHSIAKAKRAIFREWSLRETPDETRAKYFRKLEEQSLWKLDGRISEMVTFSYHNLAVDLYPSLANNTSAMDLILCRNALMYFAPDPFERALRGFNNSLVDGGWLIVSAAEVPNTSFVPNFSAIDFPQFTAFRKPAPAPGATAATEGAADQSEEPAPPRTPSPAETSIGAHPPSYEDLAALYEVGKYRQITESCLIFSSTDERILILAARAFANQGLLPEAISWGEKALSTDKNNPTGYYLLATIYQEQGDIPSAQRLLRSCLYLDDSFVLAHFSLGSIALQKDDRTSAVRHFNSALQLLNAHPSDEILPESEGISSSRLTKIISSLLEVEKTE